MNQFRRRFLFRSYHLLYLYRNRKLYLYRNRKLSLFQCRWYSFQIRTLSRSLCYHPSLCRSSSQNLRMFPCRFLRWFQFRHSPDAERSPR